MKHRIASYAVVVGVVTALPGAATAQATSATPALTAGHPNLATVVTTLGESLGDRSPGSYLDDKTGQLVVTLTDSSAAGTVRAAGAVPRLVTRSRADLRRATDELDRHARIPGTSWGVDPVTNQVVVSADESVTGDRMARLDAVAGRLGTTVRVERVPGVLSTLAGPTMQHGTAIYGGGAGCSLGFNVYSSIGFHNFLTAGHCTRSVSTWYSDQSHTNFLGVSDGPGIFGPGGDFGIVKYQGVGIRVLPTVAGDNLKVVGWSDPVIGQPIRRRGNTTGTRSGNVTALDVTTTFFVGGIPFTIRGLIKTSACAEPGDSGGPLYHLTNGGRTAGALGLLSGGTGNCSAGGTTLYQPISPIMRDYALSLWN